MQITWDLVVLVSLALGFCYGMFFARNKVLGYLVNLLLGYLFTLAAGDVIYEFVANLGFVSANLAASESFVKVILTLGITLLLIFKSETSGLDSGGSHSKFQAGFYGLLIAALALAAAFSFMTSEEVVALDSNFALLIYTYRSALIAGPILVMIVATFLSDKKK